MNLGILKNIEKKETSIKARILANRLSRVPNHGNLGIKSQSFTYSPRLSKPPHSGSIYVSLLLMYSSHITVIIIVSTECFC